MKITLTVNGRAVSGDPAPRTQLAEFLREDLLLTGTHLGCEHGVCGACTIVVNGETARSCITYAVACDGAEVRTIEGFADDPLMARLREAFSREHALQCGYCTPGMLIAARDLIRRKGDLDEAAIRREMSGNLCRCTGYVGIVRAIQCVMGERAGLLAGVEPRAMHLGPLPAGGSLIPVVAGRFNRAAAERSSVGRVEPFARPDAPGSGVVGSRSAGSTRPTETANSALSERRPDAGRANPSAEPRQADVGHSRLERWDDTGAARIEEQVRVAYPRQRVWAVLGDVEQMAACLPGATLYDRKGARLAGDAEPLAGILRVRLGPMTAAFAGQARLTRSDATWSGTLDGQGQAKESGSRVRGRMGYRLAEDGPDATRIDFDITYSLTGPLAQFGRGDLVRDLVRQVARTFAANIEAHIKGGTSAAKPADLKAGALLWSVLRARIRRILGFDQRGRLG